MLTRPGTRFYIVLDHQHATDRELFDPSRTGLDHFALAASSVEEVYAWAAHLDALGVAHEPVLEIDIPKPLTLVLLRDPDGIVIELIFIGA